jgi:hypothetical protein
MNPHRNALLAAAALVAAAAGYYLILLEPALAGVEVARTRLAGVNRDLTKLRGEQKEIARLQKRLDEIRRDLSIRDGQGVAGALLDRLGKDMGGRNMSNFTTSADTKRPDYFTRVNISFDTEGDLGQVARMLHSLTFWDEYFQVHALTVSQARGRLQCRIPTASALLPESPIEGIETRTVKIFDSPTAFSKYEPIVAKNMFEPYKPPPPPRTDRPRPPSPPPQPPPPPPRPSVEIYLSGISAETDGSYTALVQEAGNSSKFEFLRPGAKYLIYKVKQITGETIVFANGAEEVTLRFGEKKQLHKE